MDNSTSNGQTALTESNSTKSKTFEESIRPRYLKSSYSEDGRSYLSTKEGIRRVNPVTGRVAPRIRMTKKERLKLRKEYAEAEKRIAEKKN